MIRVDKLISLLKSLPPDAKVHAYEGEDIGIAINANDGLDEHDPKHGYWWVRATPDDAEDSYSEGI